MRVWSRAQVENFDEEVSCRGLIAGRSQVGTAQPLVSLSAGLERAGVEVWAELVEEREGGGSSVQVADGEFEVGAAVSSGS